MSQQMEYLEQQQQRSDTARYVDEMLHAEEIAQHIRTEMLLQQRIEDVELELDKALFDLQVSDSVVSQYRRQVVTVAENLAQVGSKSHADKNAVILSAIATLLSIARIGGAARDMDVIPF